jgi:carbon monoxide dehydrogenase subunit G
VVRVEHTVVIERSPADVFAFLADPANLPAWQRSCVATEVEGPLDVGSRFAETRSFLGRHARTLVEVVELEPGRLFTVEVVEGPIALVVHHRLEQAGTGTRVSVVAEGEPAGLLRLGNRFVVGAIEQETRDDFARLKELLESRPAIQPKPRPG